MLEMTMQIRVTISKRECMQAGYIDNPAEFKEFVENAEEYTADWLQTTGLAAASEYHQNKKEGN